MFDHNIHPVVTKALRPLAARLVKGGVSADFVTIIGFLIGMASVPLLATQNYEFALAFILVNRLCDGLDGAIAHLSGPTHRGAFIDIAFDFFFYSAIPFGFAVADPEANAIAAAGLLLAFVGTSSSFLSFAVIAQRRGLTSKAFPGKGIYYLGGLTEGAETIAVVMAMCLWPAGFPVLAWSFSFLCLVTTVSRWLWGWRAFADLKP